MSIRFSSIAIAFAVVLVAGAGCTGEASKELTVSSEAVPFAEGDELRFTITVRAEAGATARVDFNVGEDPPPAQLGEQGELVLEHRVPLDALWRRWRNERGGVSGGPSNLKYYVRVDQGDRRVRAEGRIRPTLLELDLGSGRTGFWCFGLGST